jgi:hypothetical protein
VDLVDQHLVDLEDLEDQLIQQFLVDLEDPAVQYNLLDHAWLSRQQQY